MIAVARSAGAKVDLATYDHPCTETNRRQHPELFSYLPEYLPNLTFVGVQAAFDSFNDAIREVAQLRGTMLVDAARDLPPDPDLFVDHVHFNALGADRFAALVAHTLLPSLPGADQSMH